MYNTERIKEAIQQAKKFSITCPHKNWHTGKIWEIRGLISSFSDINCYYFGADIDMCAVWGYWTYYDMVVKNYKTTKKTMLDAWLRITKKSLLEALYEMLEYSKQAAE